VLEQKGDVRRERAGQSEGESNDHGGSFSPVRLQQRVQVGLATVNPYSPIPLPRISFMSPEGGSGGG
jgi:hypothetical protein